MEGESMNFEYDESMESSDEVFESDEAYDAAEMLESDESDELYESDESDESVGAESDEAVGAAGESIESDESSDEAVLSASARLSADQTRRRQEMWRASLAADQRLEAQRAATLERSITDRLRTIQAGGTARVQGVGALQGAGVVTAILPNGRQSRMRIIPTLAPVGEVNRLRSVVLTNERRAAVVTARNSKAIVALRAAQTAAVQRLTAQQVKSDKDLSKRIVEGHNRLDQRITRELSSGTGVLNRRHKQMIRRMQRQRWRAVMDTVLVATAVPFFFKYGNRGDLMATENLKLGASTLGFMLGDEALDAFAGKSQGLRTFATVWSFAAPFANMGLLHFMLAPAAAAPAAPAAPAPNA